MNIDYSDQIERIRLDGVSQSSGPEDHPVALLELSDVVVLTLTDHAVATCHTDIESRTRIALGSACVHR